MGFQLLIFICGYATLEGLALLFFPRFMLSLYQLFFRVLANARKRRVSILLIGLSIWFISIALRADEGIFAWLVAFIAIVFLFSGAGLLMKPEIYAAFTEKFSNYSKGQLRTIGLVEACFAGFVLVLAILWQRA